MRVPLPAPISVCVSHVVPIACDRHVCRMRAISASVNCTKSCATTTDAHLSGSFPQVFLTHDVVAIKDRRGFQTCDLHNHQPHAGHVPNRRTPQGMLVLRYTPRTLDDEKQRGALLIAACLIAATRLRDEPIKQAQS
jgi:hypothetical protein